jgi:hypothetical protein
MTNNKTLFLVLCLCYFFLTHFNKELLNVESLVINSLAENLTYEQINEAVRFKNKIEWITYLIIPLLLLLKTSIIAIILDAGCFFFGKEIKYKRLFNVVVKAEFVFLLVIIVKTAWFYFFQQEFALEDLQNFFPFSALNVIGYEGLQPYFIYPLQVLNLFEVAYWLILAYLLGRELQTTAKKGISIVASSYGVSLLIWVVGVMFFTLNMS